MLAPMQASFDDGSVTASSICMQACVRAEKGRWAPSWVPLRLENHGLVHGHGLPGARQGHLVLLSIQRVLPEAVLILQRAYAAPRTVRVGAPPNLCIDVMCAYMPQCHCGRHCGIYLDSYDRSEP